MNQPQQLVPSDGSELDLTVSGSIVGTVDYMSPEQAYDPRTADGRSDIYSLGCTLHYLLTGKAPYGGQTFMERLLGHRERPVPSLRTSRRDVPEDLDGVFQVMLAKTPADRPQTMAAVISGLEGCKKSARTKPARPLLVFDDRDEKTRSARRPIRSHDRNAYQRNRCRKVLRTCLSGPDPRATTGNEQREMGFRLKLASSS